jgi:dTDP-4-dehydrorhamnose reductase
MTQTIRVFDSTAVAPDNPARPKILLIGPSGQVGWELSRSLAPLGEVIHAGRQPGGAIAAQRFEFLELAHPRQIRDVVRGVQPQLIVNAAAYTAVDKAEAQRELAMAINGVAPRILAEEARRAQAALVHYSTDYIFDGSGDIPWQEDDPAAPLNHYGATKLAGEEAIRAVGVPHLILRVSWVYGLHGANFVKTMLRLGEQRTELSIVDDQIGAPTSARVIADCTARILALGCNDWPGFFQQHGGLLHLACQGCTSWFGFAQRIFELARRRGAALAVKSQRPIPTSAYPTPARRPHNSRLNCQRLSQHFGLQPPTWEAALEHSLPLPDFSAVANKAA